MTGKRLYKHDLVGRRAELLMDGRKSLGPEHLEPKHSKYG